MNEVDLVAQRAELDNDPLQLGYAGTTDEEAAAILNDVTTGRTRERQLVPTWELLAAATRAELRALDAGDRALFQMMLSTGTVDIHNARIRAAMLDMFPAGSETRANLIALQTEPVSRATELFNEYLGYWHVAQARELP